MHSSTTPIDAMRMRRQRLGFTLVELLVVIAVIVVIVSILLGTVTGVLRRSRISNAQYSASQINVALQFYVMEESVPVSLKPFLEWAYEGEKLSSRLVPDDYCDRLDGDTLVLPGDFALTIEYVWPPRLEWLQDPENPVSIPDNCQTIYDNFEERDRWRLFELYFEEEDERARLRYQRSLSDIPCEEHAVLFRIFNEADDYEIHIYANGKFRTFEGQVSPPPSARMPSLFAGLALPDAATTLSDEEFLARLEIVQREGLLLILDLALTDPDGPDAWQLIQQAASDPAAMLAAGALLDADDDGSLSCQDLFELAYGDRLPDEPSEIPLSRLKHFLQQSLEFLEVYPCPNGDDAPSIPIEELGFAGFLVEETLSFDQLCELTLSVLDRPQSGRSLCAKLEQAQRADEDGRLSARNGLLQAYRSQVMAKTGKDLTEDNANLLITFSYIVQTNDE